MLAALDGRLDLNVRWRGGDVDRLVDSRHAPVVSAASKVVASNAWQVLQEVTYAIYGERGSIDLVGLRKDEAMALIMEVKSEVTSWEETQRKFDEKVRLLPKILAEREGWRPRTISKVIVLEDTMTNRRRVAAAGAAAALAFPARGRAIRAWLRRPSGTISGIWFLSAIHPRGDSCGSHGFHRVRRRPNT